MAVLLVDVLTFIGLQIKDNRTTPAAIAKFVFEIFHQQYSFSSLKARANLQRETFIDDQMAFNLTKKNDAFSCVPPRSLYVWSTWNYRQ